MKLLVIAKLLIIASIEFFGAFAVLGIFALMAHNVAKLGFPPYFTVLMFSGAALVLRGIMKDLSEFRSSSRLLLVEARFISRM